MLSERERELARELLELVPDSDVMSLATTSTNNLASALNPKDAATMVVYCTEDFKTLLHRKKITKEIIFKYLLSKKYPANPAAEKIQMISDVLAYWKTRLNTPVQVNKEDAATSDSVKEEQSDSQNSIQELATTFVQWYFSMYNAVGYGDGYGPDHFWRDCNLKLTLSSGQDQEVKEVQGDGNQVVEALVNVKQQHRLMFNPNIGVGGIQVMSSPYGLVSVVSCGTLHQQGTCVGVFEQKFGLVQDPLAENNWKIKWTEMVLRKKEVKSVPTLDAAKVDQIVPS